MIIAKLHRLAGAALWIGAAAAMAAGGASAQTPEALDGPVIVVEAPRTVPLEGGRSPYTGASTIVTTVRISALYGDLDLAKPADAARLMVRLDRVAHDACAQLDRLYPLVSDPDCASRATAGATATAKTLIAAARKQD
jgi:UrcA family protein